MGDDCGCDERKEYLNKMFPRSKPQCLKESEYQYLVSMPSLRNKIEVRDQLFLAKTHSRVFNHVYFLPTCNCPAAFKQLEGWYNDLMKITETYNAD